MLMMQIIFSRSRPNGNPSPHRRRLIGIAGVITAMWLAGCAIPPRIPANIILRDVHNNGYALAFDHESKMLASGGTEGRIRLWSLPDAKEIIGWQAHHGSLQGLFILKHPSEIISAAYDGVLARWTRGGVLVRRTETPSPILDMALDENTGRVITGHRDGHVRQWRLEDFTLIQDQLRHSGEVLAVAYHPGTQRLASSGSEGTVYLWRHNETPHRLPSPPTDAEDLAFAPDGTTLMGSGWFKLFRWNLTDQSLAVLPTEHHGMIKSIQFFNNGQGLATISRQTDSAVDFLDAQTGAVQKRFQAHELCGTALSLSVDGRYLATTSDDANIYIWDLRHPLPPRKYFKTE